MENFEFVIILPAYNESAHIRETVLGAKKYGKIIVVDDGSTDKTADIAGGIDSVEVLRLPKNMGKGAAVRMGIAHALASYNFEALIIMDADGQHEAQDMTRFIDVWRRKKPDIVWGVRKLKNSSAPLLRRLWNLAIDRVISGLYQKKVIDTQCGFRLISNTVLRRLALRHHDYRFDSEVLFWALKNNLVTETVPISAIYYVKKKNITKDIYRAVLIFSYAVSDSFKTRLRPLFIFFHRNTKKIIVLTLTGLLALTLHTTAAQLFKKNSAARSAQNDEMIAALEWLKRTSSEDDIILAHWYYGHQIVAFANRRIISSTKVYPSESKEVADRHKDIAKFFLAEKESDALKITEKYGAKYVFLHKEFEGWLCRAIQRCDLVNSKKKIASWARASTMAGLMMQGTEFKNLKVVWDSSNFIIYKVTDTVEVPPEVVNASFFVARTVLKNLFFENRKTSPEEFKDFLQQRGVAEKFGMPQKVDVSIWNAQKIRTSRLGLNGSLLENLIAAASDAVNDPRFAPLEKSELSTLHLQIALFGDDYAPLNPRQIDNYSLDPAKGYVISQDGKSAIFLPLILNVRQYANLPRFLNALCLKGDFPPNCYRDPNTKIFTVSVRDYIESEDRKSIFPLIGPLIHAPSATSTSFLYSRLASAAEWQVKNQDREGRFVFQTDPLAGTSTENLDWVRNILASQSLLAFYSISFDERYLSSAVKNRNYIKDRLEFLHAHFPKTTFSTGLFPLSILTEIELFRATGNQAYKDRATELAHTLSGLRLPNNDFAFSFNLGGGFSKKSANEIINYQAFTALALAARYSGDKDISDIRALAETYQNRFRSNRILYEKDLSLAKQAWLVNGFGHMYFLTREPKYADFAFEITDWLLENQLQGDSLHSGAFKNTPTDPYIYTRGTAKNMEALADAYLIAKEIGDEYHIKKYKYAFERAAQWMMLMQITKENSFWINADVIPLAIGGFRHDLLNSDIWIDSASHFLLAGSAFLAL